MRAVVISVVSVVVALAGCFNTSAERDPGDDGGAPPPHESECSVDAECVPAGPSCCSCAE